MTRNLFFAALLLLTSCMPEGSGPYPNAVLVVNSANYSLEEVLKPLDVLEPNLDHRIDKKREPEFSFYDSAYWYPHNGSDVYGVAVVKWPSDLRGSGSEEAKEEAEEMKDRYFIEIYAKDKECSLCKSVARSLEVQNVKYFSACDHLRASNAYEKSRCDQLKN